MKENCVFCKILDGELPVSMIYEDEKVAVFVDLYPVNEGHLLVIPKYHAPAIKDVDADTIQHMMAIAQKMNAALRASKYKCEGVNLFDLFVADGEVAGQEVFHCHLHVIPICMLFRGLEEMDLDLNTIKAKTSFNRNVKEWMK